MIDTSFFVALARSGETEHRRAVDAMRRLTDEDLTMPVTLLAESLGLVGSRLGVGRQRQAWAVFRASGIEVTPVTGATLEIAREIDERYSDVGFGFADCTLLAACEELRDARVLSFDRRLATYRPSFAPALEVLP